MPLAIRKVEFIVAPGQKKERIDKFLSAQLEGSSRAKVQKYIDDSRVLVNGEPVRASYKILPNDAIVVNIPTSAPLGRVTPEEIPLEVVYEDEYLVVVNKAAGMVTHPGHGNWSGTLANALLFHCSRLSTLNDPAMRPGIVHRLDKDTSGLIVAAKDDATHASLARQFADRTIEREYWALVWGKLSSKRGLIESMIARSKSDRKKFAVVEDEDDANGKFAATEYEVLKEFKFLTLVRLKLRTGRTHQIRVHFSHIGHSVFGDPTYHGRRINYGPNGSSRDELTPRHRQEVSNLLKIMDRQALHAKTLGFVHPATKQFMHFDSDLPEDFKEVLEQIS
ncbi:MAG TPA: RluA family pseudouridine synthase [Candidatus Acidoferrales bacterium]|nr:RluA family pseudouridine synthase [Candidatus Acidoferrales bacterium]